MKTQYNFFNGFNKFKFGRLLNYKLFVPLWILLLLIIWIGYLSFEPALLTSGCLSFAILLIIAFLKTPMIDCYSINGKEYVLYNSNIYYKKFFNLGEGEYIRKGKCDPKGIYFIDEFLGDFIRNVESKSSNAEEYFNTFKDLKIDNVNYFFIRSRIPKSEIVNVFNEICSIKTVNTIPPELFSSIISKFKTLISKGTEDSKIDGMTLDQHIFLETTDNRFSENENKIDDIYNKWTGKK